MDIDLIKIQAFKCLQQGLYDQAYHTAFSAIFSFSDLSWPYFILAKVSKSRGDTELFLAMRELYLIRKTDKDPSSWKKELEEEQWID